MCGPVAQPRKGKSKSNGVVEAEKSGFKHGMFSYGSWRDGGHSTYVREELYPPTLNGDVGPTRTRRQKWGSGQGRPKSSYSVES